MKVLFPLIDKQFKVALISNELSKVPKEKKVS